jgi:Tannase and feruloyl esterase
MKTRIVVIAFAVLLTSAAPDVAYAAVRQSCQSLATLKLANTTITSAESVPAGPYTAPPQSLGGRGPYDLPAFCQVAGVIKPTSDSDIKFELWMPAKRWNGKFEQVGNGGFAGRLQLAFMVPALRSGFATASTDDGHTGSGAPTWATGHPQKVTDFGYRAVHETAQKSKRIIHAFYGRAPKRAYFNGCSDGGREALMEAQRFPDDFNGILAGAPANFWTHIFTGFAWNEQAMLSNPASYIPASKLPAIQQAALDACDALDGVKDGVINDPRRCHFDPAVLQCNGADGPGCLTGPQVEALKKIYEGPRDPRSGRQIFPGFAPGAEAAPSDWPAWITGKSPRGGLQFFFANGFFANMVYGNPKWDFRTFDFHKDTELTDAKFASILNSTNPNLRPFNDHGGKLILYQGWADSAVAPRNAINYYQSVVGSTRKADHVDNLQALETTRNFFRLFMAPGMGHCGGGTGPNSFGALMHPLSVPNDPEHNIFLALEQWAEKGVAPHKIIATKFVNNKPAEGVARTRPLCPYPQEAVWTGRGSTDNAANFVCRLPGRRSNRVSGSDRSRIRNTSSK